MKIAMIEHGHLDPEANPSYEPNVTVHSHARGDVPHRHPDAPSWGAIGTQYVGPGRTARILAENAPDALGAPHE